MATAGATLFGASSGGGTGSSLFGASGQANSGASLFGGTGGASAGAAVFGASSGATPGASATLFGASSGGGTGSSLFGASGQANSGASLFGGTGGASAGAAVFGASSGATPVASLGASGGVTAGALPPFQLDVFEELHGSVVVQLVAGGSFRTSRISEPDLAAFQQLRAKKDALARPFSFRGREDTIDLASLARMVLVQSTRLASEPLIRAVDEVSKLLRLHQHDCCSLVERALDLPGSLSELPRRCATIYYRECHFQALCLHDLAQNLAQRQPDRRSVAFFAMLGGGRFVKAVFEALGALLRDLNGEKTGDQIFQSHAGTMIQLLVETLLAYFFAFKAIPEEAEQIISLLPHVVTSQHAPLGQGFTVSDLDLILHETHAEISTKLCLALVCTFNPRLGDGQLDISQIPENVEPSTLRVEEYTVAGTATGTVGGSGNMASSPLGAKMRAGDYWNEESQLGQFLGFAISGVLLEDEKALRNGYIHWHVLHFILHDALLSTSIVGNACTSRLVFACIQDLLARALLPVGRRWVAVRRLEAQAVGYRFLAPDALQITLLQTLNRLCRLHPTACETFREIAIHCTDTFHLSTPQGALLDGGGGAAWAQHIGLDGGRYVSGAFGGNPSQPAGAAAWLGAPPSSSTGVANTAIGGLSSVQVRHDGSTLYAEILDFLATLVGRGSMHCARLVCQKLMSHSNQWFNWGFLVDTLTQVARASPAQAVAGLAVARGLGAAPTQHHHRGAHFPTALCHLVAAACSSRLWVSHPPPPQPGAAPSGGGAAALGAAGLASALGSGPQVAGTFGSLLLDLLNTHSEPAVKAACLGALAHLDFTPEQAKLTLATINSALPTLLAGVSDARGGADGALAIQLLVCALRLTQAVPLNSGRYGMDLQPLTHVVTHHIYLKALADPSQFSTAVRYWRLAGLALRWLRLVLRGPLPLGALPELNAALVQPYADVANESTAAEVAACMAAGNATAFAFRCMLTLDSPVFSRALYLTLLRGRGVQGLVESRQGSASQILMEQAVCVGLDVVRLLFQRDVIFHQLYGQQAAERAANVATGLDVGGGLLLAHRMLFSEFVFAYPANAEDSLRGLGGASAAFVANPFAGRRLWQGAGAVADGTFEETAGSVRRANPSYFALLLEFVGTQNRPEICRLALYALTQCALREPAKVLQILQLEPWRLQCLSADIHDLILQPEEETVVTAIARPQDHWGTRAENTFMFEAVEMDVPSQPDAASHLDVVSFQTGLPVCSIIDATDQLADDALVQSADLFAWACSIASLRGGGSSAPDLQSSASADAGRFRAGYLRGFDVYPNWVGLGPSAGKAAHGVAVAATAPPPVLAAATCRLLALRVLGVLLSGVLSDDVSGVASKLAQALLGLDPETSSSGVGSSVDMDVKRLGQPSPMDAVFALLENPPPMLVCRERAERSASPALTTSDGRAGLQTCGADAHNMQAVDQHVAYEAALGVVASLMASSQLRDVTLRYVCHAWPSRYKVLQEHLATPWAQAALPFRRVLLSEATLLLRIAAWEMRVVPPILAVPSASDDCDHLSVEACQRLDMRFSVAEQLRDVVQCFVAAPIEAEVGHGAVAMSGSSDEPCAMLVTAALRLAEACELPQNVFWSVQQDPSTCHDKMQELLRASYCSCLAPSDSGRLTLGLRLLDPHLFVRLVGHPRLRRDAYDGGCPGARAFASASDRDTHAVEAALEQLGTANQSACITFYARASFQAFAVFVSAAFHHLAGGVRPGAVARSPVVQTVRAHLEALLPALAPSALEGCSPLRLELLTEMAAVFVAAMRDIEGPTPLTFAYNLFCQLRSATLHPLGTPGSRSSAQYALLLLVQHMLPGLSDDPRDWAQVEMDEHDLAQLHHLACALLASAGAPSRASVLPADANADSGLLERHGFCGVDRLLTNARARAAASVSGAAVVGHGPMTHEMFGAMDSSGAGINMGPDTALTLLAVLLVRVPKLQLAGVAKGSELWTQLVELLGAAQPPFRLRPTAACVSALLCQSPQTASSFFEYGGLAVALRPEILQAAVTRVSVPGTQALDGPHPACLLAVLQVLVAAVGALPSHRLVLHSVITWLDQHAKHFVELFQWVSRLPLATSTEPRSRADNRQDYSLLGVGSAGALRSARTVAAVAASSGGSIKGHALMIPCVGAAGDNGDADFTLESATELLAGREPCFTSCGAARGDATMQLNVADRDRFVAVCHLCALLFVELWALVAPAMLTCGNDSASVLCGPSGALKENMERLASQFEPAMQMALTQMASLAPPPAQLDASTSGRKDAGGASFGISGTASLAAHRASPYGMGGMAVNALPSTSSAPAVVAPEGLQLKGFYPSESVRLGICSRILQAWRHDPVAQQVQALSESFSGGQATMLHVAGTWTSAVAAAAATQLNQAGLAQVLGHARARASALCTVFVHACEELLSLRFVGPSRIATATEPGDAPHLQFEGSRARFRQILVVIEMALHLLCVNVGALVQAADMTGATTTASPTPVAGAPRLALVVQYLRLLREFSDAVGGAVAPVGRQTATSLAGAVTPATNLVDLTFAVCLANRVEVFLVELHSF